MSAPLQVEVEMLAIVMALATTQGPVKPPAPLRYRLEASTVSDQDLTSIGQGKKTGSLTTIAIISVTLTDSAEGQIARVTVDSMTLAPSGEMTRSLPLNAAGSAADSVRGAYVRAYTVHGMMHGAPQGSNPSAALNPILQAMGDLFPGLRTEIKAGDSWADTTVINNDAANGAGHQAGRIISTWKVASAANGGFVLEGTAITMMTTTAQNGLVLHISGTSHQHLVMPSRGPTRSAVVESTNEVSQTSREHPTPIPARTVGSLRLIPLP
jgi:hypothetical protein